MHNNRAVLYLRSSKDRSDVSIDAQRRQLHELAHKRGLVIVDEFSDAVESGKDEDRPAFQRLLHELRAPSRPWQTILVLDTSRVARNRFLAIFFEREAAAARVQIVFRNVPDTDPVTTMLLTSILQAMDEWHSLTSKQKGLAGMAENVRQGWRAGGRPPRGYDLEHSSTGAIRDGQPVQKSKLVPSGEAAAVAAYLRGRAAGKSRGTLLAELGVDWPTASLNDMEWRALTYAGHTVWNVHSERSGGSYAAGTKRRPRSEWVITRDTHDAFITNAEAEAILQQLEQSASRRTRSSDRSYLLAGLLVSPDETPWHGEWDQKVDQPFYRMRKGTRIAARRVDDAVIDHVFTDLQADESVNAIVAHMREMLSPPDTGQIRQAETQAADLTRKISRLIDLIADAGSEAVARAYRRSIEQYETERAALIAQAEDARRKMAQAKAARQFAPADVRALLRTLAGDIREGLDEGQVQKARAALSNLLDRIVLDLDHGAITLHYRVAAASNLTTGFNVASPRGFEPLLQP
ncbi:uncharacterized protein E1O_02010 [Burkholderiales bacterium GJ-E10]|nr:uncharacterized protein E1O_02010 [Burkholderiales bacterium GJ-E10]